MKDVPFRASLYGTTVLVSEALLDGQRVPVPGGLAVSRAEFERLRTQVNHPIPRRLRWGAPLPTVPEFVFVRDRVVVLFT